jgi:hypothetical protein
MFECSRTACSSDRAECWHSQTGRLYCVRCARRINDHNPDLVVMWRQDPRWPPDELFKGSLVSTDGRFTLNLIIAPRGEGLPKYLLRRADTQAEGGSHHDRRSAAAYAAKFYPKDD